MRGTGTKIVMTTDAVGGIWTYTLDLGRELVRQGNQIQLVVLGPSLDPAKLEAAAAADLAVMELGFRPEWLAEDAAEVAKAGQALAQLARRDAVDLVHLNHPALAADVRFDVPVIAVCHSCVATWWNAVRTPPLPASFRWQAEVIERGYRAASALVAPTRAFAEATQRAYGLDRLPTVVHNGRANGFASGPASRPVEAVVTAGRLWDEGKNARVLDRAAALMTVPFHAAGPTQGPNGAVVELNHLGCLGPLSESGMRRLFSERPIYASAALYEPFGLAVLEAAQAGCALVLSDIPSFRELWNGAALFVEPNDAEAYAAAVGRLLSDAVLRADAGLAAQNRARTFGVDVSVAAVTVLYRSVRSGDLDRGRAA